MVGEQANSRRSNTQTCPGHDGGSPREVKINHYISPEISRPRMRDAE